MKCIIFPLNIDRNKSYEEAYKDSVNIMRSNKAELSNCVLTRKYCFFDSDTNLEDQISISKKLICYVMENCENFSKNQQLIDAYFSNTSLNFLNHFQNRSVDNVKILTSFNRIIEQINSLTGKKYSTVITYERSQKKNLKTFTWVLIKIRLDESLLKESLDVNSRIMYILNDSYKKIDESFKLTYNPNSIDSSQTYHMFVRKNNIHPINNNSNISNNNELSILQRAVGKRIFEKIENDTKNKKFSSFKLLFLVPPRISLKNQSESRFLSFFSESEKEYLKSLKNISDLIFMANSCNLERFQNSLKEALCDSDCLYLIIQDECHWGIKKNSVLDEYLNSKLIINSENIYLLYVSATPYNIEGLRKYVDFDSQIIYWDDVAKEEDALKKENEKYHGKEKLLSENKVRFSSKSEECFKIVENLVSDLKVNNKVSSHEISIILEYLVTLHISLLTERKLYTVETENKFKNHFELINFFNEETSQILKTLLNSNEKKLVVMRMKNKSYAELLKNWIKSLLELFNREDAFDVILDIEESDNLWGLLSKHSKNQYLELNQTQPKKFGYNDLNNLSILLILIDKARIGDTFPSNFKFYDLRCRYNQNPSQTLYCSLIQDVGRAFGYGERPSVLLSEKIFNLFKEKNSLKLIDVLSRDPNYESDENEDDNEDIEDDKFDLIDIWNFNKMHQFGSYSYDELEKIKKRRFLLSAHPQNGKTGAFLSAVQKFIQKFSVENYDFKNVLYFFASKASDDLNYELKYNAEIVNNWEKMHEYLLKTKYKEWKKNNPNDKLTYERGIDFIQKNLIEFENEKEIIKIIDMGCGSALLAQHFCGKNKSDRNENFTYYQYQGKGYRLEITSIDHRRNMHVPDHILIKQMNMKNIDQFKEQSFDIIVFCGSLWGEKHEIQDYIYHARRILKQNGKLFIVDYINNKIGNFYLKDIVKQEYGYNYDDDDHYFWVFGKSKFKRRLEYD